MKLSYRCALSAALTVPPLVLLVIGASSSPKPKKADTKSDVRAPAHSQADRHMSRGEAVARTALMYRGAHYRFGGTSSSGYDCSGLTQAVYKKWGLLLNRTAVQQFHQGKVVHFEELTPGDLVFFQNTYKRGISHVGIYVGDGKFLHAANRRSGVIVSSLYEAYYRHHLAGARRLALDKLPELPQPDEGDDTLPADAPSATPGPPTSQDVGAGQDAGATVGADPAR